MEIIKCLGCGYADAYAVNGGKRAIECRCGLCVIDTGDRVVEEWNKRNKERGRQQNI